MEMLRKLWAYRSFILSSVRREFQSKYRNSLLGVAWTMINPLAMILIYTVIFSQVMRSRLPGVESAYSLYLCPGILTWGLLADIITRGQTVFIDNANLIKKLNFPRLCLPAIVLLNAGVNFAIIFGLFTFYLLLVGQFPGWVFLGFFPVLGIQLLFSVGLGMILGVLNVFFRDVGQFFTIFLQFWFWFTPIVYPETILPVPVLHAIRFNPMARIVEAYHRIFVTNEWPQWHTLLPAALLAVALCFFALHLFRRHAGEMVDEL